MGSSSVPLIGLSALLVGISTLLVNPSALAVLLKGCSGVTFGQKINPILAPFLIFTPARVSLSSGSLRGENLHF